MKVRLDIFEGPLDLLLYLIKKNHVDIYNIPISDVLNQYLQFLELMRLLDINVVSEYMVTAATLIQIKSRMLLPKPPEEETPEEDPRDELVRKLLEYQKYKEIAELLKQKESVRLNYLTRASSATEFESQEVYFEASIFDLINAFKTALKDVPREIFFEVIKDEFTVEDKIHFIVHLLLNTPKIALSMLFAQSKNKLEIVATFLAILELIRLKEIVALQEGFFSEIIITKHE